MNCLVKINVAYEMQCLHVWDDIFPHPLPPPEVEKACNGILDPKSCYRITSLPPVTGRRLLEEADDITYFVDDDGVEFLMIDGDYVLPVEKFDPRHVTL